ncbi:MAG: hypothetical protein IKE91_00485 [Clostridia bacterium]|nr:hypothetical protein [Clostridia bacterium]
MSKKFKNVRVEMDTFYFDIEISDKEIESYKKMGIEDDEELLKQYLEDNFDEYVDLLTIDDFEGDLEE